MFSSEAFVADLFAPVAAPIVAAPAAPATRPAILPASEAAALLRADVTGSAWMPDDIDELPSHDLMDDADVDAAPNAMGGVVSPRDAQLQALRAQAMQEAEAALHEALAEREAEDAALREQIQAEAYAAGIEAGRAEAEAAAQEALGSALQALWLATEEVRATEARWLMALEDNIAALVAASARHVIGREVARDDALVRGLAARAVAEYPQDHPLHVRVHPADLSTLKGAFEAAPRAGELRWTTDARIERGGVLIEGRDRIVDGRVDTALERIYRTLSGHHA